MISQILDAPLPLYVKAYAEYKRKWVALECFNVPGARGRYRPLARPQTSFVVTGEGHYHEDDLAPDWRISRALDYPKALRIFERVRDRLLTP